MEKRLQESGITSFGKLHKNELDYYHLRPRLLADQETLMDELLGIYQARVNISSWFVKEQSMPTELIITYSGNCVI